MVTIMWISVDDVINFTGLKPKHLNLEKDDTTGLNNIVSDWINQSQDLINMYTNRNYTDDNVRDAIRNICLRLTIKHGKSRNPETRQSNNQG